MSNVIQFPSPKTFPKEAAEQEYANATFAREQAAEGFWSWQAREKYDAARERWSRAWRLYMDAI